jgi:hypothetical protein
MSKKYPDDLSGLTDDELMAVKLSVETDMASVKQQLDEAKGNARAYGEYSDPDWYSRANGAKRFLGITHQKILGEISQRRRSRGSENTLSFERAFVQAAKLRLTEALFYDLVDEANRAVE